MSSDGISTILPLLLSMYNSEMLTANDITARCAVNPAKIFGIALDENTFIEVDETQAAAGAKSGSLVRSVTLRGEMIYSDSADAVSRHAARIQGINT